MRVAGKGEGFGRRGRWGFIGQGLVIEAGIEDLFDPPILDIVEMDGAGARLFQALGADFFRQSQDVLRGSQAVEGPAVEQGIDDAAIPNLKLSRSRRDIQFELCNHKIEEMVPTIKTQIAGQSSNIIEKSLSGA